MNRSIVAGGLLLGVATVCKGGYSVAAQAPDSGSTLVAPPGTSFVFSVVLTSDTADECDSAILRVIFSDSGLSYSPSWMTWSAPYLTGGIDDLTAPSSSSGPGTVSSTSYAHALDPTAVDLYFENLTPGASDRFGTGVLLQIVLSVPANWSGPDSITVDVVPDTFTDGAINVEAVGGSSLVIMIPSPGALGLLVAAGIPRRRVVSG